MAKYHYTVEQLAQLRACPWLTDRERRIFDLYYRRGWHIEAVAAELDVSRGTVNNALRRIRQKLP